MPLEPSAIAIERWPLDRLVPYANNARLHSDEQVAQLAESIRAFGFTIPVLADEAGGIIAGHGRVLAARRLGLADVPVVVARGWTDEQRRAYVIADNKLALNATWDEKLLRFELGALRDAGFDLGLTGFAGGELRVLFAGGGLTDPDASPEPPVQPVSRPGDLWLLGEHRVLCGSSTDAPNVTRLLGGARPNLMVTDPPYGVNYDPKWRVRFGLGAVATQQRVLEGDDRADWREAWALFPGNVAYIWHGGLQVVDVAQSLAAVKFGLRSQIIWVKTRPVISRGNYHWQHETAFYAVREGEEDAWRFREDHAVAAYAVREGEKADWRGGRKQTTVWFIETPQNDTGHSTQKPVDCMRRPIENNSEPGAWVYDPFLGSGTTLIAAQMTGRICFGLEIDPAYCDVIVKRWQAFVGERARLELSGLRFDEVEAERKGNDAGPQANTDVAPAASRQPDEAADAEARTPPARAPGRRSGVAQRAAAGGVALRNRKRAAGSAKTH